MANIAASGGANKGNEIYNYKGTITNNIKIYGESSKFEDPVPTRLWFEVPDGIQSFYGREEFLPLLHDTLQQNKDKGVVTILSQMKVLVGMGGIGKTQTARRYICQYESCYENVIWIEAETKSTLENSFNRLAGQLGIAATAIDDSSVEKIYRTICAGEKSTLFVFDNADDFKSGIDRFLPPSYHPDLKSLAILFTSRIQDWTRRFETAQVLPLDVFTPEESLNFIRQQLNIPGSPDENIREETQEFIQIIGGLPLALQQSVAFIIQKKHLRGSRANFFDYIKDFKAAMARILSYDRIPGSPSTIFVTWEMTSAKLKTLEDGVMAVKIIEALAFLYADCIRVPFIQSIFCQVKEEQILRCLMLLEKYSLIKLEFPAPFIPFVTIHRQLQFVLLQNLKDSGNLESVLDIVINGCYAVLKTINSNVIIFFHPGTFVHFENLVDNPLGLIPTTEKLIGFILFLPYLIFVFDDQISPVDKLCEKVYKICLVHLGDNHVEIKFLGQLLSSNFLFEGREPLLEKVVERLTISFGPEFWLLLESQHKMGEALYYQGKYPESIQLFEHVLEQKKKLFGDNIESTLRTQTFLATSYEKQREWSKGFELYQEIEKTQAERYGSDCELTLKARGKQARMLMRMERFEEASKIVRDIYEKTAQKWGEDNVYAIQGLKRLAKAVEKEGKLEEALQLRRKVLEQWTTNYYDDSIIDAESEVERLLRILNQSENTSNKMYQNNVQGRRNDTKCSLL